MKHRFQLFEFEDLPWFPDFLRQNMMDFLRFAISFLRVYEPIVPLLHEILVKANRSEILDLGSGGGGGIIGVHQSLTNRMEQPVKITLSDLYPNIPAFDLVKKETQGAIDYLPYPVNATDVPAHLTGCRTIFSAFHHFPPPQAQAILADAARKRVPIGVFEGANKSYIEILLAIILMPIVFLVATPFMRPFRLSRLIFTYLIPLIPLCTIWDGCVSILRIYTPQHLLDLTQDISGSNYTWQTGKIKHKTGLKIIYLIGFPVNSEK